MLQLPMTKILKVNQKKCIGCNTCPLLDPSHFAMDETTYKAKVIKQPQDENDKNVKTAIDSCPVGAITLE